MMGEPWLRPKTMVSLVEGLYFTRLLMVLSHKLPSSSCSMDRISVRRNCGIASGLDDGFPCASSFIRHRPSYVATHRVLCLSSYNACTTGSALPGVIGTR